MKTARVRSRCECQSLLEATLDENGVVIFGQVTPRDGVPAHAPATAMGVGQEQFQVGWLCNYCHRNTLRSFYRGALIYQEQSAGVEAS